MSLGVGIIISALQKRKLRFRGPHDLFNEPGQNWDINRGLWLQSQGSLHYLRVEMSSDQIPFPCDPQTSDSLGSASRKETENKKEI